MTADRPACEALPSGSVPERQAGLPAPLRELHRRLLGEFLARAAPPALPVVAGLAAELGLDPQEALRGLAAADLVHADPASGAVSVAYPFSGRPTPHRVRLDGGAEVWAMCALDALGIPQMARRGARISSTDPGSGQPVTVEARGGTWRFEPATTVVLVPTATGGACGAVADCCCPHINFHAGPQQALAWLRAHPGLTGTLLEQADAVEAARRTFGGLLDPQGRCA